MNAVKGRIHRVLPVIVLTLVVGGMAACSGAEGEDRAEAPAPAAATGAAQASPEVLVYKSPTCGCCSLWAEHMRENGFTVVTKDVVDLTQLKQETGVPRDLFSCHTAIVDGYVIEGHVPADVIRRVLQERPDIAGVAVPGMPMGSPGMEGSRKDPYDIVAFDHEGTRSVYESR